MMHRHFKIAHTIQNTIPQQKFQHVEHPLSSINFNMQCVIQTFHQALKPLTFIEISFVFHSSPALVFADEEKSRSSREDDSAAAASGADSFSSVFVAFAGLVLSSPPCVRSENVTHSVLKVHSPSQSNPTEWTESQPRVVVGDGCGWTDSQSWFYTWVKDFQRKLGLQVTNML